MWSQVDLQNTFPESYTQQAVTHPLSKGLLLGLPDTTWPQGLGTHKIPKCRVTKSVGSGQANGLALPSEATQRKGEKVSREDIWQERGTGLERKIRRSELKVLPLKTEMHI